MRNFSLLFIMLFVKLVQDHHFDLQRYDLVKKMQTN